MKHVGRQQPFEVLSAIFHSKDPVRRVVLQKQGSCNAATRESIPYSVSCSCLLVHHRRVPIGGQYLDRRTKSEDERYDSSNGEDYANKAPISQSLPTVHPAERHNATSFQVTDNGAADWSSFVDDEELGEVDHACEHTALTHSQYSSSDSCKPSFTKPIKSQDGSGVSCQIVMSSENGIM